MKGKTTITITNDTWKKLSEKKLDKEFKTMEQVILYLLECKKGD